MRNYICKRDWGGGVFLSYMVATVGAITQVQRRRAKVGTHTDCYSQDKGTPKAHIKHQFFGIADQGIGNTWKLVHQKNGLMI